MSKEFGQDTLIKKKVLTPTVDNFPLFKLENQKDYDKISNIICKQMDINKKHVLVGFTSIEQTYSTGRRADIIKHNGAVGYYKGTDQDGKHIIEIDERFLSDPVGLIATIAHELSHVRLLGEKRINLENKDHELYADILSIFFGFGVFVGATAFRTRGWTEGLMVGWSQSTAGYLSLRQIGYALALYAKLRGEIKPEWRMYISDSVIQYFDESMKCFRKLKNHEKKKKIGNCPG